MKYFYLLIVSLFIYACKSSAPSDMKKANHLINESSPYLLQHAYNPVDWYPWSEEALEKAKREDKMLLVSIGYASCHWCHVMEHESFEDSLVAKVMNDNFVCIKIDREERPDVDDIYMTACQLVSGSGGWPLNAFALPDGRPVWAGTYFPKEQWTKILDQFAQMYQTDKERLIASADKITKGIQAQDEIVANLSSANEYKVAELAQMTKHLIDRIDFRHGGRSGSPKFPMPNNYDLLMKYYALTGDVQALDAVNISLQKMARGGIYDQLGGGFARYSVDSIWLVPHFEKMLYDNGQMLSTYSEAYKLTNDPLYKRVIQQTIGWANREMRDANGGYYASLDADSDGEEGKFYVWQESELDSIITDKRDAEIIKNYYTIRPRGNWEHTNILYVTPMLEAFYREYNMDDASMQALLEKYHAALMAHRDTKVRPPTDDKVLTSWNGLLIKGLVQAYQALGEDAYLQDAIRAMDFINKNQVKADSSLYRNYKDGKSAINAFLDDYATVIDANIALYEATFDEQYLAQAKKLTDYTLGHFLDKQNHLFNYTSDLDPALVARKKEINDNVIPASNSMMARNLYALGTLYNSKKYKDHALQMLNNILPQIQSSSAVDYYSNWLQLYADLTTPTYEIAIVGPEAKQKAKAISKHYMPNALLLGGETEGSLALLKDKLQEGETYIYVCQNKVCKLPVTDVDKALDLMK